MYEPQVEAWNARQANPADRFTDYVITTGALAQRLQSGFLSGTPVPDAAEIEISMAPTFFSGPLDSVGFADLTDAIKREGLDKRMNPPSFSPWTNRGRIFGLPGDVHPVLLAYRADIVEAAGIDVSKIETWDDFVRVMKPLMNGPNGTRYLLNMWETDPGDMETLVLQAGGGYFDANLQPILDSDINARVLAKIVTWIAGPGRISVNAPSFDANGNYMYLSGQVLGILMPDWLCGVWLKDLPGLSGKMKLMPLPAWDAGGLRTSVSGGSMIGIPKRADFARSWPFIKYLYTSHEVARQLYQTTGIITPVREFWNDPIYNEPNPYFSGQATGRLYIAMADKVPARTSSSFKPDAEIDMNNALIRLKRYAETNNIYDESVLRAQAKRELAIAQADIVRRMASNAFLAQAKP
jgi:arabinosaccharide transport system substrate-binding protein